MHLLYIYIYKFEIILTSSYQLFGTHTNTKLQGSCTCFIIVFKTCVTRL